MKEHRQVNRDTLREENMPVIDGSEIGAQAHQALVDGINQYARNTLDCKYNPQIKALLYDSHCPSSVGIGRHHDQFAQKTLYPESSEPMVVVRYVMTEKHSGVKSTVTFKTYRGHFSGSGVSTYGPNDAKHSFQKYTWKDEYTPISTYSVPKEGPAFTYASLPGVAGYTPLAFYTDNATALLTTHEVDVEDRHLGTQFCILADFVFGTIGEAVGALEIMKHLP